MKVIWLFLFACASAFSASERITAVESGSYLLGAGVGFYVPGHMPGFEVPVLVYGPRVAVPVGGEHLEVDFNYGGAGGLNFELEHFYCVELDYRWHFTTPHLEGFAVFGGHYTYYDTKISTYQKFGPTTGFGISFPMSDNFRMALEMHGYLLDTLALSFGGNFIFTL